MTKQEKQFYAYLHKTLRFVAINWCQESVKNREAVILNKPSLITGREFVDDLSDSRTVESIFMEKRFYLWLEESLSERQLQVIKRTIFDGFTDEQVAQEMGLTRSGVTKLRARTLRKLKTKLEEER